MSSKFNWTNSNSKKKTQSDKAAYTPHPGQSVGMHIAALKLIKRTFEGSKELFQWTDFELYLLGKAVRKEWQRRKKPLTFKHGVREVNTGAFRYPSVTGEAQVHTIKRGRYKSEE